MEQDASSPSSSSSASASKQAAAAVQATKPEQAGGQQPGRKGRPEKNLYQPYRAPTWLWALMRLVVRVIFRLLARVEVRGREHIPATGPVIIAANHLSWFDVPLFPAFMKRQTTTMAKEELFYSKIGWLVRFLGAFPVKRGEGDRQSIRAADDVLKAGHVFFIFPEGTRSKTHTLAKGHSGLGMIAVRSGAPVVPAAVTGTEHIFKQFRPRVTISFSEPLVFKPEGRKMTREDIERATEETMEQIAALLPPEYRGAYQE